MFASGPGFQILLIFALILLNGVFAMSEIAVVSARKTRLKQRADAGDAHARRALELAEDPSRFLSTVQIGITLIGVFAGAYGGASLARHLDDWLNHYPAIEPYSEEIALAIVVAASPICPSSSASWYRSGSACTIPSGSPASSPGRCRSSPWWPRPRSTC